MKKLLYILSFFPLSLLGQVGIGTDAPSALLEIKTDDTGIAALALTPQATPKGSATGQMAVIKNILYMFDATRKKWLSVENTSLEFGRLGWGSTPKEIEFGGGDIQNGAKMPFDGTITNISMVASSVSSNREILLFINDIPVANNDLEDKVDGVFDLTPSIVSINKDTYNVDFNKGDVIKFEVDPDVGQSDIIELRLIAKVKWRKDNL